MEYGITIFPTDYSISPADLAIAAEERDFESLWVPEHSHIPVSRKSPWPGGPELPKMYYDVMGLRRLRQTFDSRPSRA